MKKLLAIMLALGLLLSLFGTAMAADEEPVPQSTDVTLGDDGLEKTESNTITLIKSLILSNYDDYGPYAPDIVYTYTMTAGGAGVVTGPILDKENEDGTVTVTIKAGSLDYLADPDNGNVQTVTFVSTDTVDDNGDPCEKTFAFTFDPEAFPSAGVYSFVITETSDPADPADIGIVTADDYENAKTLLVYVKNDTKTVEGVETPTLAIYGYALVDGTDISAVNTDSGKTDRWEEEYPTYNITITKHITGDGADMTAEFPFTAVFTGEMGHANIAVDGTGSNITDWPDEDSTGSLTEATIEADLGDSKTLIVSGLPITASFAVAEGNPTDDQYTIVDISVTGADDDNVTDTNADLPAHAGELETVDAVTVIDTTAVEDDETAITLDVTNNLDSVSPTGVIMRVAPYALILVAGIALLMISRRKESKAD